VINVDAVVVVVVVDDAVCDVDCVVCVNTPLQNKLGQLFFKVLNPRFMFSPNPLLPRNNVAFNVLAFDMKKKLQITLKQGGRGGGGRGREEIG